MHNTAKDRKNSARIVSFRIERVHGRTGYDQIIGTDDQGRVWDLTYRDRLRDDGQRQAVKDAVKLYNILARNGGPMTCEKAEKVSGVKVVDVKYAVHTSSLYDSSTYSYIYTDHKLFLVKDGYIRALAVVETVWTGKFVITTDSMFIKIKDGRSREFVSTGGGSAHSRNSGLYARLSVKENGVFVYNVRRLRSRDFEDSERNRRILDRILKKEEDEELNYPPPPDQVDQPEDAEYSDESRENVA